MNQPLSACGTLLNDISDSSGHPSSQTVQLPEPLGQNIHNICQPSPKLANLIQMDLYGLPYILDDPMDVDDMLHDNQPQCLDPQNPAIFDGTHPGNVKEFPGASQAFPHGSTFMDQFFFDKYGELRKENLYYLFTSQQDWQPASWLLHSHLSMAAINSFLSLQLVSTH